MYMTCFYHDKSELPTSEDRNMYETKTSFGFIDLGINWWCSYLIHALKYNIVIVVGFTSDWPSEMPMFCIGNLRPQFHTYC